MIARTLPTILVVVVLSGGAASVRAADPAEERLLGGDHETDQLQSYLPFTRARGVSGIVSGSLADSTAAAGVPPAAMLDALKALATTVDLGREVHDGDRFYVRFEQTFTIDGTPFGVGRVLWVELQLASKRIVGIHRFRSRNGTDSFWTINGQGTTTAPIRMPVEKVMVSSGFGLRVDPLDQPAQRGMGMGPMRSPSLPPGLQARPGVDRVNVATPLGVSLGLSPNGASGLAPRPRGGPMVMHEGVDLVAPLGTPIVAAADGVIRGAAPKGRYGNWVEIEHAGSLATVYGHLSAFAPGIQPGAQVLQGDVIGYVGSTGRTTGPHVHFELLVNGRPVNPMVNPAARRPRLMGPDLVAFRKIVAQDQAERQREAKSP